jgi:hypothetical protein
MASLLVTLAALMMFPNGRRRLARRIVICDPSRRT